MNATQTTIADIVEWDNIGGRLPAQTVGELARPARVVDAALSCIDLERIFLDEPALSSVLVEPPGGDCWLISRGRFFMMMIGRLGYGRALLVRRTLADLPPVDTLVLPAGTSIGVAASAAATRADGFRYDDVVVRLADGALGTLPVADLFAELALARSFIALHDSLTGLPNRAFFLARLAHLQARDASAGVLGVLFVDVDDFKSVNDSQGHAYGDALLKAVAERLRTVLRSGSFLARFGGDEFAILLEGIRGEADAVSTAKRIGAAFIGDWSPDGFRIGVSVGAAVLTAEMTSEALVEHADAAMYEAKRGGKGSYVLYSPTFGHRVQARRTLRTELQQAVAQEQFSVVYQPIVELDGLRMVSVEALVRWMHPTRGVIAPAEFIPEAEEMDLIEEIDNLVLREALRQVSAWRLAHPELQGLMASVNVSPLELTKTGFVERVLRSLAESKLPPTALTLEITEGFLIGEDTTAQVCRELAGCGVRLSIDDFGTGFSSLAYLQRLHIDCLKIDRRFVAADDPSEGLLEAIVKLAQGIDMATVAEGIESERQLARLRGYGCSMGQGYLLSRPVTPDAIPGLLVEGRLVPPAGDAAARDTLIPG